MLDIRLNWIVTPCICQLKCLMLWIGTHCASVQSIYKRGTRCVELITLAFLSRQLEWRHSFKTQTPHTKTVSRGASTLQKILKATSWFESSSQSVVQEKRSHSDRHRLKYPKLHSSILLCQKLFFSLRQKAWWNIFRDLTPWMMLSVQIETEEAVFAL